MKDDAVIDNLKKYIKETLKIELEITPWNGSEGLPFILRNNYNFYVAEIFNHSYLLLVAQKNKKQTPTIIDKQIMLLVKNGEMT